MEQVIERGRQIGAFFRNTWASMRRFYETHPGMVKALVVLLFLVGNYIVAWFAVGHFKLIANPHQDPSPTVIEVLVLIGVLYAVIALFGYRIVGPERFNHLIDKMKGVNQPGTAEYLERKEVREFYSTDFNTDGIFLGTYERRPVILPAKKASNKNVCIIGSSGSGKSASKVRNDLFQAAINGRSVIVTDPKGELTRDFRLFFQKKGYIVKVFNLVDMRYSDRFNMLDLVTDDIEASQFCEIIMANTSSAKADEDQFWSNAEKNLLKALVLLIIYDDKRPHGKTMRSLYDLLAASSDEALAENFKILPHDHPAVKPFNVHNKADAKVRAGAMIGLAIRLQLFQNKLICDLTSKNEIDLVLPGKMKCAYFCIIPDNDRTFDFLSATFFAFLFKKLMNFADSRPDGRLIVPVSFELDEIRNIGKIPHFDTVMATLRSREMDVTMALQSIEQLMEMYPDTWETIYGDCCDTKMIMGAKSNSTVEYISKMVGIGARSGKSFRRQAGSPLDLGQYTVQDTERMLINPDEVRRMKKSEALVVHSNQNALKVDKLYYKDHFMFPELIVSPIQKYAPTWSESYRQPKKDKDENLVDIDMDPSNGPCIHETKGPEIVSGNDRNCESKPPQTKKSAEVKGNKSTKAKRPGKIF